MKLDHLELNSFRCFQHLVVNFHPHLTALVANNGQGKSTILDAIRIALWPFIKSFDLAQASSFSDPTNGIRIDDVTQIKMDSGSMARQLPSELIMSGDWGTGADNTWVRSRISEKSKTKTRDDHPTKLMIEWATDLQHQIRNPAKPERDLPMFGYYGTGRLWAQKKLMKPRDIDLKDTSFFIRTFGYQNCMDI